MPEADRLSEQDFFIEIGLDPQKFPKQDSPEYEKVKNQTSSLYQGYLSDENPSEYIGNLRKQILSDEEQYENPAGSVVGMGSVESAVESVAQIVPLTEDIPIEDIAAKEIPVEEGSDVIFMNKYYVNAQQALISVFGYIAGEYAYEKHRTVLEANEKIRIVEHEHRYLDEKRRDEVSKLIDIITFQKGRDPMKRMRESKRIFRNSVLKADLSLEDGENLIRYMMETPGLSIDRSPVSEVYRVTHGFATIREIDIDKRIKKEMKKYSKALITEYTQKRAEQEEKRITEEKERARLEADSRAADKLLKQFKKRNK